MSWIFWLFIVNYQLVLNINGQRADATQNSQQYQQPHAHGQPQHIPVDHHAPIHHQQQNVPAQPNQYQQHQNIPAQQHGHNHGPQLLNSANMEHERGHIAEHANVPLDTSKMSDEELQFHYFKMHDADNNNKLDGSELIKSLIHWHEQGKTNTEGNVEEKLFTDEELTNLIDPILNTDDENKDGFIDYPEFIRAQRKAAAKDHQ